MSLALSRNLACVGLILGSGLNAWTPAALGAEVQRTQLWPAAQGALTPPEYALVAEAAAVPGAPLWTAENAAQGLRFGFTAEEVRAAPLAGTSTAVLSLRLVGWGRGGELSPPANAELAASGSCLEYRRGPLSEWYVNAPRGLEQGFTIAEPPPSGDPAAPLELRFALQSELIPELAAGGREILLRDRRGEPRLWYSGLAAWDASDRPLAAWLELGDGAISIRIDAREARYPVTVDPYFAAQQAKLTASDPSSYADFGRSVASSGDTAVVGAYGAGAAYVFVRSGTSWSQQAKLTPSDPTAGFFGYSVAVSGDTAIVGAFAHDYGLWSSAGSAFVFVRSGTSWTEQALLQPSDPQDYAEFGRSVALAGDTAVVGTLGANAAYAFVRSGGVWSQQAKLTASDAAAGDVFGASVSVAGDTAVVGDIGNEPSGFGVGSAYVFVRSGAIWSEQAKLTASDGSGSDFFGTSVAVDGDTALVGADAADVGALSDAGAAYVFVRSGTSWSQQAKLTASDAVSYLNFGRSVSVSGDTAAVLSYVFVRTGTVWTETLKAKALDQPTGTIGVGVALSGDTMLAGAPWDAVSSLTNAGSVYVFRLQQCGPAPALEVPRLGTPPNPAALLPGQTSGPVLGATWDPKIDHTTFLAGIAYFDVLVIAAQPANQSSPWGTILCDLSAPYFLYVKHPPGTPFSVLVPRDCALLGATACAQGASSNPFISTIGLTNALDVTIGTF